MLDVTAIVADLVTLLVLPPESREVCDLAEVVYDFLELRPIGLGAVSTAHGVIGRPEDSPS